jgi:hypothetical protein
MRVISFYNFPNSIVGVADFNRLVGRINIGSCFPEADESKMLNCVSASAEAPHIEAELSSLRSQMERWNNGIVEKWFPG